MKTLFVLTDNSALVVPSYAPDAAIFYEDRITDTYKLVTEHPEKIAIIKDAIANLVPGDYNRSENQRLCATIIERGDLQHAHTAKHEDAAMDIAYKAK